MELSKTQTLLKRLKIDKFSRDERKRKKDTSKQIKRYNKMVGIHSGVEHDIDSNKYITDSLSATIKKHDDPYAFAADVMKQQRDKKLPLKRRGAASARELVAAWKRRKSK